MEVPRLGVQLELQLPAYTTPIATQDLGHSSWQCQILSPLSEARDQTRNLMVPSRIHFLYTMTGNSLYETLLQVLLSPGICFVQTISTTQRNPLHLQLEGDETPLRELSGC